MIDSKVQNVVILRKIHFLTDSLPELTVRPQVAYVANRDHEVRIIPLYKF